MGSLVLYVDGSSHPRGKECELGYGLVALHDNGHVEAHGSRTLHKKHSGHHEYFAFLEGVAYAVAHGFKPSETAVYTDDEVTGYMGVPPAPRELQPTAEA